MSAGVFLGSLHFNSFLKILALETSSTLGTVVETGATRENMADAIATLHDTIADILSTKYFDDDKCVEDMELSATGIELIFERKFVSPKTLRPEHSESAFCLITESLAVHGCR